MKGNLSCMPARLHTCMNACLYLCLSASCKHPHFEISPTRAFVVLAGALAICSSPRVARASSLRRSQHKTRHHLRGHFSRCRRSQHSRNRRTTATATVAAL